MMGDDEEPIEVEYTVRISGGEVEHEQIRETIHELDGKIINEESVDDDYCNFYDPDVEEENKPIVCPACDDVMRANTAAVTVDQTNYDNNDNVISTTRRYICSEECAVNLAGVMDA